MTDASPSVNLSAVATRARAPEVARRTSLRPWAAALLVADLGMAVAAAVVGALPRLDSFPNELAGVPALWLAVIVIAAWPATLAACGAYDTRFLATGSREFRSVGNAGVWMVGGIGFCSFVAKIQPPRSSVLIGVPLVVLLTAVERYGVRRVLHKRIVGGRAIYRTLIVGNHEESTALARHIERVPWAGFRVVGTSDRRFLSVTPDGSCAQVDALLNEVRVTAADTIAIAGSGALPPGLLRALSWRMEGTGIRLVLAPTVTDITGPRIMMRPVEGLPLLHVEDPELRAGQRLFKAMLDRVGAFALLLLFSPILLGSALAVALSSRGPVIYRQERVGHHGKRFSLFKFRTMVNGADRIDLAKLNECDGLLFKVRLDPRMTGAGRHLRRLSLDELPQLVNVLRGNMSLVGPRPPLASEVERYGDDVRRRLLVKPGMTGLWQIGGRSALPWDEAVRLDLYYVENWSVAMDVMVLWKTLWAVIEGRGAW